MSINVADLCGWSNDEAKLDAARSELEKHDRHFKQLNIFNTSPTPDRMMIWEYTRKVLGRDVLNYTQLIGDCTSFATKNCVEYMQTYPLLAGDRLEFTEVFPPYFYGCSRVLVGGERGSYDDGSVGAWNAQAVMKYGVLSKKTPNVPEYSKDVAKSWGAGGPPDDFLPIGEEHLVKSTAAVTTEEQLISALSNLYPVSVCSDYGFDMTQRSDGMFYHSTTWSHNMTFIGYQLARPTDNFQSHVCLLNNWADAHGTIKDFVTGDTWPVGTLRILLSDAVAMLQARDTFAYSSLDYFKASPLDPSLFDIF